MRRGSDGWALVALAVLEGLLLAAFLFRAPIARIMYGPQRAPYGAELTTPPGSVTPTPGPATPRPPTPTPKPVTPTPKRATPTPTPTPKPATPAPKRATPTPKRVTPTPKPAALSTWEETMAALEEMAENLETKHTFVFTESLAAELRRNSWEKFFDYAGNACRMEKWTYWEDHPARNTLTLEPKGYSPGWKIAHTVRLGRPESTLSDREREALRAARAMVSAAGRGSAMEVERRLHDALCARVRYNLNGHATEIHNAVGALVDGEAVCEGYTDAFYLLCSLAGIPARYQGYDAVGREGEGGHIWNLVRIDGAWVMVDVTWDDDEDHPLSYHYFNVGKDRARETHLWHEDRVRVPWIDVTRESLQPEDARETKVSSLSELTAAARAAAGKTKFTVIPSASLRAQAERDFQPFWDAVRDAGAKGSISAFNSDGYGFICFYNLSW